MATSWARTRSLDRIRHLCAGALEDHELRRAALDELAKVVPFSAFVWPLADPESATGLSPMARIPCPEELPALIRLKYLTRYGRWTALAGPPCLAVSLLAATEGTPACSPLWDGMLRRYGVTDILSTVFADKHGCWGWLDLWRGGDEGVFTDEETAHLALAAPVLATGLRRSRAAQWRRDAAQPGRGPLPQQAVLTLDETMTVTGQTASAGEWVALLQPGPAPYQAVPAEVFNVAAQLAALEAGVDGHEAMSRVPIGSGDWALLRATRMERSTPEPGRTVSADPLAVTIQECPAADRLEVFARCFALTRQQHRLLGLTAGGLSTAELAAALQISPYTVQDLFKSIFAACGVRSRGALLAMALGTSPRLPG
ncbi:helix-turn-helix transcriptional regulator [Arthrobacter sp. PM3]|uniref:helix-turn-helix transcriptional regulator n=1 Tax=Arthrobacter sp. PM3 TaxID=2017685 RepID=UPI000E10A0E8|nr:helix-turn-helix transcriptional regulator [Arthrobacter sp. PM3]AXJ10610.1 LuxR family transcriptional regulator [Arthrobacter sp. PM3]